MDNFKKDLLKIKVNQTIKALAANNIKAIYVDKKEDVISKVKDFVKNGDVVSNGGSVTLSECGVIDFLRNGNFKYLDRTTTNDVEKLYRDTFSADCFFCSCNAVTENGELYNVDGNSNRIAAICYGPKKVIMIVGTNKIVKDINSAVERVKTIAAPVNCVRLDRKTPCSKTGKCIGVDGNIADGCNCKERICCNYLVSGYQRISDRINIIFVGEELGY